VEKLVYGGDGLSRDDGRVILTPLVLPGERITVEPLNKINSRLLRIEEPSPLRVDAPCPHFGICGGCHFQHAPYAYQVEQKVEILREVISRVARMEAPEHIRTISVPTGSFEYRNRTQLHIRDGEAGYLRMGSHELRPVEQCPISSPRLNDAIQVLTEQLVRDRKWPAFIRTVEFFTNEQDVQMNVIDSEKPLAQHFFDWMAETIPGFAPGAIRYEAAGFNFRVGPRSFFQVNRFLVDALTDESLRHAGTGETALDLYAGVGLFALPLSARHGFAQVVAVESGASAIADLKSNTARAGIGNVEPVRSATAEYLAGLEKTPDFVVADPPREGLGKSTVRELIRLRPKRLAIVACDPATLARDLQALVGAGFRLVDMAMVDLFPQTYHVETVAHLES